MTPTFAAKRHEARLIIKQPLVTEKSALAQNAPRPVYTFMVSAFANKPAISQALKTLYKIIPEKIRIINVAGKQISVRGKIGIKPGFKKALVYLPAGQKLDIV